MTAHFNPLPAYRAALDWWSEAGIDSDFSDEPIAWLRDADEEASAEALPAPAPAPQPERSTALTRALAGSTPRPIGADKSAWPSDLAGFREWWLREPSLDEGAIDRRVAPRGEAGAELMVLVGQPDEGDRQVLLSGEQGRVLDAFARAAGFDEARITIASALPCPAPLPDWAALAERGLGAVTRHHVALVRPRRLLCFGRSLATLFGTAPDASMLGDIPLMIAPALETIDRSPARKKRFWQQWLEWSA